MSDHEFIRCRQSYDLHWCSTTTRNSRNTLFHADRLLSVRETEIFISQQLIVQTKNDLAPFQICIHTSFQWKRKMHNDEEKTWCFVQCHSSHHIGWDFFSRRSKWEKHWDLIEIVKILNHTVDQWTWVYSHKEENDKNTEILSSYSAPE